MYVSIRVLGAMLKTGLFYCSVRLIFLITGGPLAKFATLIIFSLLVTILIHNDMMQNQMHCHLLLSSDASIRLFQF